MSAPLPGPGVIHPREALVIEELLETLSQMVTRCEEMVAALERAAVVVRPDPLTRVLSTTSFD